MPFEKYMQFLEEIDISVFNSDIQIAMGNIITLLGLGKKVYLRKDITTWQFFSEKETEVYDVENIELELLSEQIKKANQQKIKNYFSEENYLKQLQNLFEDK